MINTVILAGGGGTRLQEETYRIPKPMVEIGGKPILWHIMKIFSTYNFNDFIICAGYKQEIIKNYFVNYKLNNSDIYVNSKTGRPHFYDSTLKERWNITISDTGLNTLTANRILKVKDYLDRDKPFFVTYGDGVTDVDITDLLDFHKSHNKIATVTTIQHPGRFGMISLGKKDIVKDFHEKPTEKDSWINGGFFVFNYEFFDYIPTKKKNMLEQYPLIQLTKDKQLVAYRHTGKWKCMDTLRDKNTLNDLWNSNKAFWKVW